jgi:hypothetical protein
MDAQLRMKAPFMAPTRFASEHENRDSDAVGILAVRPSSDVRSREDMQVSKEDAWIRVNASRDPPGRPF